LQKEILKVVEMNMKILKRSTEMWLQNFGTMVYHSLLFV